MISECSNERRSKHAGSSFFSGKNRKKENIICDLYLICNIRLCTKKAGFLLQGSAVLKTLCIVMHLLHSQRRQSQSFLLQACQVCPVYRYSFFMDCQEADALTGNGSPQRSRPRRAIASDASLSLS